MGIEARQLEAKQADACRAGVLASWSLPALLIIYLIHLIKLQDSGTYSFLLIPSSGISKPSTLNLKRTCYPITPSSRHQYNLRGVWESAGYRLRSLLQVEVSYIIISKVFIVNLPEAGLSLLRERGELRILPKLYSFSVRAIFSATS